jgi:hypothetical protein
VICYPECCPVTDFRHTIDRVSAVSSQSTPLARQFSPTFGTGCFTQSRTPAGHAGGRGLGSRRSRQSAARVQSPDAIRSCPYVGGTKASEADRIDDKTVFVIKRR